MIHYVDELIGSYTLKKIAYMHFSPIFSSSGDNGCHVTHFACLKWCEFSKKYCESDQTKQQNGCRQCCSDGNDGNDGRSGVAPVFFMDKAMP